MEKKMIRYMLRLDGQATVPDFKPSVWETREVSRNRASNP